MDNTILLVSKDDMALVDAHQQPRREHRGISPHDIPFNVPKRGHDRRHAIMGTRTFAVPVGRGSVVGKPRNPRGSEAAGSRRCIRYAMACYVATCIPGAQPRAEAYACLLYTSDAADE